MRLRVVFVFVLFFVSFIISTFISISNHYREKRLSQHEQSSHKGKKLICVILCNSSVYIHNGNLYVIQHIKRSLWVMTFCYFLNGCPFSSILVQKCLKSDIAFLRYGNFIEDIITVWWKVDYEKKSLKIWESVQGNLGNLEVHFYMKTLFLHQIL